MLNLYHHLPMLLPLLTIFTHPVHSWGYLGHRTVAYLAQHHFTPSAHAWINSLLLLTSPSHDISEAAVWPDRVVHTPTYSYTKTWHYIDALDDPPRLCQLNFSRDCADGSCIIGALVDQTARLTNESLSREERAEALKFVLHLFGDVHQPLHTENMAKGGNGIEVYFDDELTNLHSVWDTHIPKKRVGVKAHRNSDVLGAKVWSAKLWNKGDDLGDVCLGDMMECALEWATEANQLMCEYVLKDDVEGLPRDLGEEYFEGAVPIVDMQVQRAGRRLAAWINDMAPPIELTEEL